MLSQGGLRGLSTPPTPAGVCRQISEEFNVAGVCRQISEEFNVAVLITNHVMSDPSGGAMFVSDPKKPVGGHVMAHASTIRLSLRKGKGEQRVMKVVDAPNLRDPPPPCPSCSEGEMERRGVHPRITFCKGEGEGHEGRRHTARPTSHLTSPSIPPLPPPPGIYHFASTHVEALSVRMARCHTKDACCTTTTPPPR